MGRSNIVQVTLELEQIALLKRQALKQGLKPSTWARVLLARSLMAEQKKKTR